MASPLSRRAVRGTALALVGLAAHAVAARAERLAIAPFTTAHGLAYDRVLRIVRDSHGFLWFCTSQGLSRFDGRQFRNFTSRDGLPESVVDDLLEAKDGTYWVATDGGGVARFDPRKPATPETRFAVFPVGDTHVTAEVHVLRQDRAGRIWAGTNGGLFRLEAGGARFERVLLRHHERPDEALPVWALLEDADGSLWIGHERGLSRLPSRGDPLHYALFPFPGGDTVWSLVLDGGSRLWIAHELAVFVLKPEPLGGSPSRFPWRRLMTERETMLEGGGVRLPEAPGEAGRYTSAHGLIENGAGPLLATADGHVWVGNGGLSEFDGRRFRSYSSAQGLPESGVKSLGEDADGNVWIGTRSEGALRFWRQGFVSESMTGVPGGDLITSFVEDGPGQVWAVLAPGRLRRYEGAGATTIALPLPRLEFRVGRPGPYPGIIRDRGGEWWAGTANGVYRFAAVPARALPRTRPRALYTARDGLAADGIGVLFEDAAGDLWIGHTTVGPRVLSRWSRTSGAFRAYGEADGLPSRRVSALTQDKSGRLFVAFYEGGMARLVGERFEILPGLDPVEAGSVSALHVDAAGRLWIATSRGGLRRLDDTGAREPHFVVLTTAEGLASNAVRALAEDRWGRIYAASLGGIDCLEPSTLLPLRRFTRAHGLVSLFFEASYRDTSGRLWFGTSEGITRLDPQEWKPPRPPSVRIGGLRVTGEPQPVADLAQAHIGPLSLAATRNTLEIDFLSLDFSGEPRVFEYRLDGAKAAWSAPTAQTTVHYANLAPGRYRFQVRALGAGSGSSDPPAEVAFTISPPLWGRSWFQAAALAAVLLLGYGAYRARLARLLALERVRTRIASDLHDDIGANLSQIAILSEVARRQAGSTGAPVSEPLERIAGLSRESVDSMGDIVWAINPRRDSLGELSQRMRSLTTEVLAARGIRFRFQGPAEAEDRHLDADLRRQVFLVFKEALNNLARHSECAWAEIDLKLERDMLVLRVSDDGRGLDVEQARAGEGHGLGGMAARARGLGGVLEIDSSDGRGAAITLKVPVHAARRRRPRPEA